MAVKIDPPEFLEAFLSRTGKELKMLQTTGTKFFWNKSESIADNHDDVTFLARTLFLQKCSFCFFFKAAVFGGGEDHWTESPLNVFLNPFFYIWVFNIEHCSSLLWALVFPFFLFLFFFFYGLSMFFFGFPIFKWGVNIYLQPGCTSVRCCMWKSKSGG